MFHFANTAASVEFYFLRKKSLRSHLLSAKQTGEVARQTSVCRMLVSQGEIYMHEQAPPSHSPH